MPRVATMTLAQLSVLRLTLRLQRVKAIGRWLQRFKDGAEQHLAVLGILQAEDEISGLDFGLLMLESRAMHDFAGNGRATLPVALMDGHYELALRAAKAHYGAEAAYGGQADQAELLAIIAAEQEGVLLALKTATEINDVPVVSMQKPRERQ